MLLCILIQLLCIVGLSYALGFLPTWLIEALVNGPLWLLHDPDLVWRTSWCSPTPQPQHSTSVLATGLARLPANTRGELARLLRFRDFAALSSAERGMCTKLWDNADVWQSIAAGHGISVSTCAGGHMARRAFRRAFFRIDGLTLREIADAKYTEILEEATHMLSGLMPEDVDEGNGKDEVVDIDSFCKRAEHALEDLDPEKKTTLTAAERFLQVARRALPILNETRVEQLEFAYQSSWELHSMMMSAMKKHLSCQIQEMEDRFWEDAPVSLKMVRGVPANAGAGPLMKKKLAASGACSSGSFSSSSFRASKPPPYVRPQADVSRGTRYRSRTQ